MVLGRKGDSPLLGAGHLLGCLRTAWSQRPLLLAAPTSTPYMLSWDPLQGRTVRVCPRGLEGTHSSPSLV